MTLVERALRRLRNDEECGHPTEQSIRYVNLCAMWMAHEEKRPHSVYSTRVTFNAKYIEPMSAMAYWLKAVRKRMADGDVKMSRFCAAQLAHVAIEMQQQAA